MPRPRGTGPGPSERINVRLDGETAALYRQKANERGMSVSEYLRQTLVQGVIAENVADIEERLTALIQQNAAAALPARTAELPESVLLSIFTSEALLAAIVEARDVQELYAAQQRARSRLDRLKAG